jgi:site-specific DNA recombinase
MTKLILIARVSDEEQRQALPAQERRLLNYAEQHKDYPYEYHEFDESAHKEERSKFAELVEHIKQIDGLCWVVFDKIDRFTRDSSQEEVKALQQLVKQGKIELHFPHDSLYINRHSSAADWFRLGIGMALAKYYSDSISDNVKRRFEQMLEDGIWVHRAPIGYKNVRIDEKTTTIEIDTDRAPHIKKAFELRSTGLPYEVIAKQLADDGLIGTSSKGKPVGKAHLEQILNNPFYYGVMVHNGKKYPHKYEPLISRDLFNRCEAVKVQRKHDMTKHNSEWFTLKKLPKCGRCGRAVSSYWGRKQVYLRCSGSGLKSCGNPNAAEALLLNEITDDLTWSKSRKTIVEKVIVELKSRHENQQLYYTQTVQQTRNEYDAIKQKLKTLYYDRIDGRITVQQHDEIANELEAKQQILNERLVKLTKDNKSFQVTASYLLDLAERAQELFECSNYELRQKLLSYMISNVGLLDKKLSYILTDPFKQIVEANKKAQNEPNAKIWQGRQGSNLRPTVLETVALPAELLPFIIGSCMPFIIP